jgi:fatty acid desaturase
LLFKHFDIYRKEHMLHHNAKKLLTDEDEFAEFVFEMCGLEEALPKRELWRRVLINLVSPWFHARFLTRRIRAAWGSHDRKHNALGIASWGLAVVIACVAGRPGAFAIAWVLPVTVLLQIATVFRILCEHRFPQEAASASRDKDFVAAATTGVFPGVEPPAQRLCSLSALCAWIGWWANMLTVQLFVRIFVLVGDAPCHDYHHRHPASRRWTSYIQARQADVEAPQNAGKYNHSWGLFHTVDGTLASLAETPRGALG